MEMESNKNQIVDRGVLLGDYNLIDGYDKKAVTVYVYYVSFGPDSQINYRWGVTARENMSVLYKYI